MSHTECMPAYVYLIGHCWITDDLRLSFCIYFNAHCLALCFLLWFGVSMCCFLYSVVSVCCSSITYLYLIYDGVFIYISGWLSIAP